MFGFSSLVFQYDPAMNDAQTRENPWGKSWKKVGNTVFFGPVYAARVLDQEESFIRSGAAASEAARAQWVIGLSAEQLRQRFPQAVDDAQKFRLAEAEIERALAKEPMKGDAHAGEFSRRPIVGRPRRS
jgi:hypothetical protein